MPNKISKAKHLRIGLLLIGWKETLYSTSTYYYRLHYTNKIKYHINIWKHSKKYTIFTYSINNNPDYNCYLFPLPIESSSLKDITEYVKNQ